MDALAAIVPVNRHTLITELAENGAGDETIMEIAGHVSRQMLSRYAHIRTEAKRNALEVVERKRAAERKRINAASHWGGQHQEQGNDQGRIVSFEPCRSC